MKCSCGREVPFDEMIWKCSCGKRLCSNCLSAKMTGLRRGFLCQSCHQSYNGRSVKIDCSIRGEPGPKVFWALIDRDGNVMTFKVEGKMMGGYGPFSEVCKMSDFLSEDRIMGVFVQFCIGRCYIRGIYPPLKVRIGTRDIKVIETVYTSDSANVPDSSERKDIEDLKGHNQCGYG